MTEATVNAFDAKMGPCHVNPRVKVTPVNHESTTAPSHAPVNTHPSAPIDTGARHS